jgi:two-component system sensor histidine kinase KdpD
VAHDAARFADGAAPPLSTTVLALPLNADERTIGALVVRGDPMLALDAARRRFLAALSYYATLGLERARLFAEAAHAEALREANRAKDQILASVSHDLRTPLTTIKVLAQGAESRGEPSAPAIVEQADRLARMVRDLLELSRLRAGSSVVTSELNTAEDLVGAALRQAQGILDGKTVVPHVDLNSPVLVGTFDFVHTLRILGNLIENALHYTPPGGVVDLRARREGPDLLFIVADRGSGVHPSEAARIFDAFYRPSGATPDTGHAGLGLSIARTLAELQGGTLTYAIRDGGGSQFTLRLPAADVDEPAIDELT